MDKKRVNIALIALEVVAFVGLLVLIFSLTAGKPRDNIKLREIREAVFKGIDKGAAFSEADAKGLKKYYGLDASNYKDFCLYLPTSNMDAAELLIVIMKDEDQASELIKACEKRLAQEKTVFESYGVDQMKLLNSAKLISYGRYLAFIICDGSEAAADEFRKCVGGGILLSTNSQGEDVDINNLSTLSTEEITIVDSSAVENTESGEIADTEASETVIEENTETEESTQQTETKEKLQIVKDAEYYFPYYSAVFSLNNGGIYRDFDEKEFLIAYKKVMKEDLEDCIDPSFWEIREGGTSLSLNPTDIMFAKNNASLYIWMARAIHTFELIEEKYSGSSEWDNPDSLKPQYHCHVLYAANMKTPWNIESFRTETDFLVIMLHKGNPPN